MPLCDTLDCVHLQNPVTGWSSGSSDVAGRIDPRVSFCRLALCFSCHCHTLFPFTCADDFLSLWSLLPASQCHSLCGRLRLRVLFLTLLHCTSGLPTLWNFASSSFCWIRPLADAEFRLSFSLLLCTVFLLNAAVFADLALYLAVGGLASVELSCFSFILVLQARLAPIPRLPILAVWSS